MAATFTTVKNSKNELAVYRYGERTEFTIVAAFKSLDNPEKVYGVVEDYNDPIWIGKLSACKIWISKRFRKKNPNMW